ncbi:MAG TPA: hypothetical protein VE871_14050 [Longimicrobium sp.]|nr:hypothetical protein [Longimicrobium sp.]
MPSASRALRLPLLAAALLCASAACDAIVELSGGYTGPPPATDPLAAEAVRIAEISQSSGGPVVLLLDRTRFVEARDPHNVNRVVKARPTPETQAMVAALELREGERVVITTEYSHMDETGGEMDVPNWPGHSAMEYPVSAHRIVSITRAAP